MQRIFLVIAIATSTTAAIAVGAVVYVAANAIEVAVAKKKIAECMSRGWPLAHCAKEAGR